jgi:hypothetical protein
MEDRNDCSTDLSESIIDAEVGEEVAQETGIDPTHIQRVVELGKARYSGRFLLYRKSSSSTQ